MPKKITDCTDREICEEFLYHIGVPKNKFSEIEAEENLSFFGASEFETALMSFFNSL
ncbi:oleate hydratase [Streptococcus thermophilus]|uniref:oleate hydratase n=1 Tax=Streptococcus thermophilus TaxID=1308 RepID=UPI0028800272|nr:oleate hydratase [Streptococcus thermophilus]